MKNSAWSEVLPSFTASDLCGASHNTDKSYCIAKPIGHLTIPSHFRYLATVFFHIRSFDSSSRRAGTQLGLWFMVWLLLKLSFLRSNRPGSRVPHQAGRSRLLVRRLSVSLKLPSNSYLPISHRIAELLYSWTLMNDGSDTNIWWGAHEIGWTSGVALQNEWISKAPGQPSKMCWRRPSCESWPTFGKTWVQEGNGDYNPFEYKAGVSIETVTVLGVEQKPKKLHHAEYDAKNKKLVAHVDVPLTGKSHIKLLWFGMRGYSKVA